MPSHRRASACMALLSVLLLVAMMPSTTGAAVAADDTLTSYVDYFLGDLFENNPRSTNRNTEPKAPPRFRPWRIIYVPDDGVLAFDCASDVPTLRVVPRSDDHAAVNSNGVLPAATDNTCGGGGAQAGTTPTQYKFSRPGTNDTVGYSALFWGRPTASTGEEEGERQLTPMPKFQLKAILKAAAAMMESSWRKEMSGDEAMRESVAFSADMVVFYFNHPGWLVAMGREDVEFRQPLEMLDGKIKELNLGTVV